VLALGSGLLLGLSWAGETDGIGGYGNEPPRAWEAFDPSLTGDVRSVERLHAVALGSLVAGRSRSELGIADALYRTVTERFTHGWARHSPSTNWILWSLGHLHPGFAHIYDPQLLVSGGHSLVCEQAAVVLGELFRRSGLPVRLVGLTKHVAVEVWADGEWRYFDPDLEVRARTDEGSHLPLSELSRRPELVRSLYAGERGAGAPILLAREGHFTASYPGRLDWKSAALAHLEGAMQIGKYLLPGVGLLLGGYLFVGSPGGGSSPPQGPSSLPTRAIARKRSSFRISSS